MAGKTHDWEAEIVRAADLARIPELREEAVRILAQLPYPPPAVCLTHRLRAAAAHLSQAHHWLSNSLMCGPETTPVFDPEIRAHLKILTRLETAVRNLAGRCQKARNEEASDGE